MSCKGFHSARKCAYALSLVLVAGCANDAARSPAQDTADKVAVVASALTSTVNLTAGGDTTIKLLLPNTPQGSATTISVSPTTPSRGLLFWSPSAINSAIGTNTLVSATLELTIAGNASLLWGIPGQSIALHRLKQTSSETAGTWSCAVDSQPSNLLANCSGSTAWNMSALVAASQPWVSPPTATATIKSNQSGVVSFNVTTDVAAIRAGTWAGQGWLLKKVDEILLGDVDFKSREQSSGVPRLVLQLQSTCTPVATNDTTCDGIDDDCDGVKDENYVATGTTCGVGGCARTGTTSCVAGVVVNSCVAGAPAANDATCNGVDDDCDGTKDENYVATTTSCGQGACAATGVTSCVAGAVVNSCVAGTPAANDATCNGIDDDCDGPKDENYASTVSVCGVGACAAAGVTSCVAGVVVSSCVAGTPAINDATCNDIDDDCDGVKDENYVSTGTSCGVGACAATGVTSCVAGTVVSSCVAGTPAANDATCNGIDDDCDGTKDENYVSTGTSCGVGACAATGATSCVAGAVVNSCTQGIPAANDASCNGIDDDCDGNKDEDFVSTGTSCGQGACAATGATSCIAGAVVNSCVAGTPAASDATCDGVDDDCDGSKDENYVSTGTSCGQGACAATGATSCVAGAVVNSCVAGTPAASDATCDGVDDDCDGTKDENYASTGTNCGVGACAATGVTACVAGTVVDSCTIGTAAANDTSCNGTDDDCDGTKDEDFVSAATSCGQGACAATGATACVAGAVVDSCAQGTPAANDATCNGIDDDCDGTKDEDFVSAATGCGQGACAATGVTACLAGTVVDSCSAGIAAADDATCNGIDEDCDGTKDEDFVPSATSCGVGACAAAGATSCVAGAVVDSCAQGTAAANDATCDGIDDDCDGDKDEDFVVACVGNGVQSCVNGATVVASCDDANACTADICLAATCTSTTITCDDGNSCTSDSCDPALGCVATATTGANCDDHSVCTVGDACDATGTCIAGTPVQTSDDNPCTDDACDPLTGVSHLPVGGRTCDDQNACTAGDACTMAGTCVPSGNVSCDDTLFCNGTESCNPSSGCAAGTPPVLADGVACTDDTCDETADAVVHTPNNGACGNANACDGVETCNASSGCLAGTPPTVPDAYACTADACDPALGVAHTPNDALCVDANQCTTDACSVALGCTFTPNPNGTACTLPGAATAQCTAGACTVSACDANHGNCDSVASNGCEVDLTASSQNCGACNVHCAVNEHCEVGACVSSGIKIASASEHSCAVMPDGRVMCWGQNSNGELGDGTFTHRSTPVYVVGLNDAISVDAGGYTGTIGETTCALRATGDIACWGRNGWGQLGDGSVTTRNTPVSVVGIHDAVAIAVGRIQACAVRSNGHVMCWGSSETGRLGNGNANGAENPLPVEVSNLVDAVALAGGDDTTCALRATGQLACWGLNQFGEAGVGNTSQKVVPAFLASPNDIIKVAAGLGRTCAIRANHTLMCWGLNIGSTPAAVAGLTGVVDVAVSKGNNRNHICAALDTGVVKCWGASNDFGQLGTGNTTVSTTPVSVLGVTNAVRVACGNGFSCAVLANDRVTCWGENGFGNLGNGLTANRSTADMTLLQYPGCSGPSCSTPQTGSITVDGRSNIWGAGLASPPGDGLLPPILPLTFGTGAVVTFPSVTGTTTPTANGPQPPDGVAGAWTVPNGTAIAGYTDTTLARSMVGVFLGPITPGAPPPAALTIAGGDFPYLYPIIGQTFFIGDGHTAGGALQSFYVPLGATRLALGVTDLCNGGGIGCFTDNTGAYTANISVASSTPLAVQVDLSRFPTGAEVPAGQVISNQWQQLGILFSARKANEAVGAQGSESPIVPNSGLDCPRYYFFNPDVQGAVGIFRFVLPGTTTPTNASHFEMVAGWDAGESITLVGLNQTNAVTAQQTFPSPCSTCNSVVSLDGLFRYVEVRTTGNPGIGFANCGVSGGYGLRFTRVP